MVLEHHNYTCEVCGRDDFDSLEEAREHESMLVSREIPRGLIYRIPRQASIALPSPQKTYKIIRGQDFHPISSQDHNRSYVALSVPILDKPFKWEHSDSFGSRREIIRVAYCPQETTCVPYRDLEEGEGRILSLKELKEFLSLLKNGRSPNEKIALRFFALRMKNLIYSPSNSLDDLEKLEVTWSSPLPSQFTWGATWLARGA